MSSRIYKFITGAFDINHKRHSYLYKDQPRTIKLTSTNLVGNKNPLSKIINHLAIPLRDIKWQKIANPESRYTHFNIARLLTMAANETR